MEYLQIALMGIVQGLTEFLPVSSSGHAAIVGAALDAVGGSKNVHSLGVNIILHLGTLGSILVVFRRTIARLFLQDRHVMGLVLVGTAPAVVVGLLLKKFAEEPLANPLLAGCMLPVTGLILLWASRQPAGDIDYRQINYRQALLIGLGQAFAILPGISRSGTTISVAMALGIRRDAAATFSFMLAIPVIAGAGLLEGIDLIRSGGGDTSASLLCLGAAVSFVVGVFALVWLLRWLQIGRLHYFAFWVIPLGIGVVIWQLTK